MTFLFFKPQEKKEAKNRGQTPTSCWGPAKPSEVSNPVTGPASRILFLENWKFFIWNSWNICIFFFDAGSPLQPARLGTLLGPLVWPRGPTQSLARAIVDRDTVTFFFLQSLRPLTHILPSHRAHRSVLRGMCALAAFGVFPADNGPHPLE